MKKFLISLCLGIILSPCGQSLSAAPIPYSGKVAINGANFQGDAPFTFALRDANGTIHWRNGADAESGVTLNVDRGLYICLLGGNTMNDFPKNLFLQHPQLFLVVHFFRPDIGEWLHLQPDQLITSAPHALAAEVARNALTADAVKPGAITKNMLAADILADLNATVVLPEQNATIAPGSVTLSHLSSGVRADLNGTIPRSRLAQDVLVDLNRSIVITRDMLPASVLADLNRTITKSQLGNDVLSDLNRTINRSRLAADVLADLNGTITRSRLAADVLADLNSTIATDSITLDKLSPQVRADLNSSIPAASVTAAKMHPDLIKYFLPEITSSPAGSTILQGAGTTLAAGVAGKFLTYQWRKNGANLAGETNPTLVIAEANATVHDANYTVVVSNDWGSVTTGAAHLAVATAQPVITLLGDANVTVEAATSYSDAGATAVDAIGGDLNASISVSSNVNLMAIGAYSVLYSVADAGGNQATVTSRTVNVADNTSPVITLLGDANVTHVINTAWVDPGASAADTLDGNLSSQVAVSGAVDVNATGAYVLTYSVSDGAGNAATPVTRGVQVLPGTWDKRFGGSSGDIVQDVIATTDGGYLLAGYSDSPAGGDKSEAGRGSNDYWAVKIAADGSKVWDKRFGGSGNDVCESAIATTDGGYLLAGYSNSGAEGDKSEAGRGDYDYWAVKINSSGAKLWDKRFGGSSSDTCRDVVATTDGGYLLVGWSQSPADGDKSEGYRGNYDMWAVKIDANGAKLWDKRFGGSTHDLCESVVATTDGGYLLAGRSQSPADGDKSEAGRGDYDMWAVKINSSGAKVWDKRFGGSSTDICESVTATSDGGYLLAGHSQSPADGDKSEAGRGSYDYWAVKINASGTKVWDKRFGGSVNDYCYGVTATTDGGYLLAGHSSSDAGGDKSEVGRGSNDYWAVKIAADGSKVWDKRFGGSESDQCYGVIPTTGGGYLLAGLSYSPADGDKSEGTRGSNDYWSVKIDANGNK
jgi:hypothetical protein